MNWTIFLNFLTAIAVIPPLLKWLFVKGYRIDLRRQDFAKLSSHLSQYIKRTYNKRALKEPAELQAETNVLMADDKTNYLLVFHALDNKVSNLFSFLKDIKYSGVFLKIKYRTQPLEFRSLLSKKKMNLFFGITFGLHLLAIGFWTFSEFILPSIVFGIRRTWFVLGVICLSSFIVSISTRVKIVEVISRKVPVTFPNS